MGIVCLKVFIDILSCKQKHDFFLKMFKKNIKKYLS